MSGLSVRIDSDAVLSKVAVVSKRQVLDCLADKASVCYGIEAKLVAEQLERRENLGSTGFGGSVAIPHARIPKLEHSVGLFCRSEQPIEYDAHDGRPVDLFFCLLSPEQGGAEHLKALAEVSRFLRDEDMLAKLRGAAGADALYVLLTGQREQQAA